MSIEFPGVGEVFLGRYDVTELLGRGGMSRVYGAVQRGIDRQVAIKVLAPIAAETVSQADFDRIAARFEREAKIISRFRSPHTVVMYDYGAVGDLLFMILEYVDGTTLDQLVKDHGPAEPERVARILQQALASLAEAHSQGILHRDIKPQNIMIFQHLDDPDYVKVLDFGIAKAIDKPSPEAQKLTAERTVVGTPSYMSPEQILGEDLTPASDIYSLGLVAYELLYGIAAVEADSHVSTMARHLAPDPIAFPQSPGMPPRLVEILQRMVHKDIESRYQSATDVLADLTDWTGGSGLTTLPRTQTDRPRLTGSSTGAPRSGTNRPLVVLAGGMVALVVTAGIIALMLAESRGAEDEAVPVEASARSEKTPEPDPPSSAPESERPEPVAEEAAPSAETAEVIEPAEEAAVIAGGVAEAAAGAAQSSEATKRAPEREQPEKRVARSRETRPDPQQEPEPKPRPEAESKSDEPDSETPPEPEPEPEKEPEPQAEPETPEEPEQEPEPKPEADEEPDDESEPRKKKRKKKEPKEEQEQEEEQEEDRPPLSF